ncbi:ABC-type nitrate/sulfonate/bicarbonate transport system, permease component [Sanguibacter keddieii DSM 10542]|uniref:ABC-type nitrate/sulfonate/bicarbonate transport system, permease component n=1 Tax=Sanguibacter keddieii (strain ATCC 51767 / DSM 10542 / NCFB 3025 / ST-74) TaxID=446469 RepID=D1BGS8_SANKS|nr:ABC transporter permease [Sanguibacter keddieii]ACZ21655.1 ABC-type nitrate/sulfonate/bicarbonate transport system, permease component [Sanguibacter keddieii DSM 10542]
MSAETRTPATGTSPTAENATPVTGQPGAVTAPGAAPATSAGATSTPTTSSPQGSRGSRRRRAVPAAVRSATGSALPVLGALGVAIGLWYAMTYLVLPEGRRFLLPPPHQVLTESVLDWSKLEPMLVALALTAQVALTGLVIAVVLGISQAILMSQARWLERSLYPYAVILQTIPILALVPLIGLWFGFGFTSRVIVCVIIALFPMISNTLFGIQSAEPAAHDLFTLNKATRAQRLWKLQMPAAVPSIFAGLKISAGLAVIGAIVGDMFFRQGAPGIGSLLDVYRARVESENLLTAIGLASLFGVLVFAFFTAVDKAVLSRWYGKR